MTGLRSISATLSGWSAAKAKATMNAPAPPRRVWPARRRATPRLRPSSAARRAERHRARTRRPQTSTWMPPSPTISIGQPGSGDAEIISGRAAPSPHQAPRSRARLPLRPPQDEAIALAHRRFAAAQHHRACLGLCRMSGDWALSATAPPIRGERDRLGLVCFARAAWDAVAGERAFAATSVKTGPMCERSRAADGRGLAAGERSGTRRNQRGRGSPGRSSASRWGCRRGQRGNRRRARGRQVTRGSACRSWHDPESPASFARFRWRAADQEDRVDPPDRAPARRAAHSRSPIACAVASIGFNAEP